MSVKKAFDDFEWKRAIKKRFRQLHPEWEIPEHKGQMGWENGTLDQLAEELAERFDYIIEDVDY